MSTNKSIPQWQILLILLLIMLAGFAARVHLLERQSMWTDEGLSLYRAQLPLPEVLQNSIIIDGIETRDMNPPLYFFLLNIWKDVGGETMTSLRLFGALAGWLAIPLMFLMGMRAYDYKVGLAAALLIALSPFHIWQSQVLRNYGLLATLNLFSVYGLMRFALADEPRQNVRWLLLWAVAALMGIYTHYFGILVFAFGLVTLLVLLLQRYGPRLIFRERRFLFLLVVTGMLFIPAALIAIDRFQQGQQIDFEQIAFWSVLRHAGSAYGVGISPTLFHPMLWYLPAVLLFTLGILVGVRWRKKATLILLGYQIIPLGLLLLLSVVNPLYNGARHLLIGLPPFLIFVAVGTIGSNPPKPRTEVPIWRTVETAVRVLMGVVVIVIQLNWLNIQFTDSRLLRDDIRTAALFLNKTAGARDIIILHDTIIAPVFDYYYDGDAPWQPIPLFGEHDLNAAAARLKAAGESADRIWFLTRPTPRTGVPRADLVDWADDNWIPFFEKDYPRMWLEVRLNGYTADPVAANLPENGALLDVTFDNVLKLHTVEMPGEAVPGAPWLITSYWSSLEPKHDYYEISIRLYDEAGNLQYQTENSMWQKFRVRQWPEGELLRFDQEVEPPAGLAPGVYSVRLQVLNEISAALDSDQGTSEIPIGSVMVVQAAKDPHLLQNDTPQEARFGPVNFLGFNLPDGPIRPGHEIPVELFWQVRNNHVQDLMLRLRLLDEQGRALTEQIVAPTSENYPPEQWQKDDVLRARSSISMPAGARDEIYKIEAALVDAQAGNVIGRPLVLDQPLRVSVWPLLTDLPAVANPLQASFGSPAFASLYGYDLQPSPVAPGEILDLRLVWQAEQEIDETLFVFIHVTNENGEIIAQHDGRPAGGSRPTTSWREGEVIIDSQPLFVGPEVAPGAYDMWVGFYDPDTGGRAAVFQDGPAADGRMLLGKLLVSKAE